VKVFFDSTVLVSASESSHPHYPQAREAMLRVSADVDQGFLSMHSVAEVFAALTRLPVRVDGQARGFTMHCCGAPRAAGRSGSICLISGISGSWRMRRFGAGFARREAVDESGFGTNDGIPVIPGVA